MEENSLLYARTTALLGRENMLKIKNANICICGVGGVGSYVLEAIARVGVGRITIIDKDVVDPSNINRQLVASWYTVGLKKAEVGKTHVETVNREARVNAIVDYISDSNVEKYITGEYDYVIDAIDSVDSKVAIIKRCNELGVKVISSMGMANKVEPLKIKVAPIEKTQMCPLAKVMRKRLKEQNISNIKVVYSEEEPIATNGILGSVPYVPSVAGLIIASEVIKDIINRD